jgi:hypothetical protein
LFERTKVFVRDPVEREKTETSKQKQTRKETKRKVKRRIIKTET